MIPDRFAGDDSGENSGPDGGDLVEQVIVTASVLLVVATLGFVAWQAVGTSTGADPVASVEEVRPSDDGERLQVVVRLDNRRATGLTSVQVGISCGATQRSLEFTHVPTGGHRIGSVVCPAGTTPEVAVETWIEA